MAERPSWLRVVGGTDHVTPSILEETAQTEPISTPERNLDAEGQLVGRWLELTGHLPADYHTAARPERVAEAAAKLKSWTVEGLNSYLAQATIWSQPSFTKAAIEEVRARMLRGNLQPRD